MPGIQPFLDLERHISRASYARTAEVVAGVHVACDGASGRGTGWVAVDQQLLADVVGQAGVEAAGRDQSADRPQGVRLDQASQIVPTATGAGGPGLDRWRPREPALSWILGILVQMCQVFPVITNLTSSSHG